AYDMGAGAAEGKRPDILHCHDWQAALAPAYVRFNGAATARTVLTIHNIAFQGLLGWDIFNELRLDFRAARESTIEYYGVINSLKAYLLSADRLTSVSLPYALEIKTQASGMGLEGVLAARGDALVGILHGIDETGWDPRTDRALH